MPGARRPDPGSLHLTLAFLGAVPDDAVAAVEAAVQRAAANVEPFVARLGGLGAFPSAARARVVWAGVEAERGALDALHDAVWRELAGLGVDREARAFTPHVTLARLRAPAPVEGLEHVPLRRVPFDVTELALVRSHLHPRGARHERLLAARLGGARPA